jgi:hypothetical protein
VLQKVENLLDMDFSQTCTTVETDGTMGFDVAYGPYKLVRKIHEDGRTTKEVYTVEGLTIYDENGLALSRRWSDMPASEQSEVRKVFARGYSFAMSQNGEIKELFKSKVFEHELPWFHALRIQQAIYYPGYPVEEGTIWNWRKPVVFPEVRDHTLSRKSVPTEREYEFVDLREVGGIPCATVSVQENSEFEDSEAKVSFSRRLVEKAHVEKATGMAVLVEGSLETEISSGALGSNTITVTSGKFTISRMKEQEPGGE